MPVPCAVRSRSSILRIFPETVLGSSANSSRRMRLYGARTDLECSNSTLAVSGPGSQPSASTTYAFGTDSRTGSGAGTTAASATASCSSRALSSSNGEIL